MKEEPSLLIYCIQLLKIAIYHGNPHPIPCLLTPFFHQSNIFDFKKEAFLIDNTGSDIITCVSMTQKLKNMSRISSPFSLCFRLTVQVLLPFLFFPSDHFIVVRYRTGLYQVKNLNAFLY